LPWKSYIHAFVVALTKPFQYALLILSILSILYMFGSTFGSVEIDYSDV